MTQRILTSEIYRYWPNLKNITYLNTASTGLLSDPVIDSVTELATMRSNGEWQSENTASLYTNIKAKLSSLLGGDPGQYAFVPSTSLGLNFFGHAIEYSQNSNIVISDLEFPSNYIPWQNISKRYGVELRIVRSEEGAAYSDAFEQKIDSNTRIVAISHVQFGTGFRADLRELASIIHGEGGYLVVDVIQSAGWKDFNLEKMGVDFAAGQATKWIAGPIGAGYAYVKKEILPDLNPIAPGWRSIKNHRNFEYFQRELSDDAAKFEGGSVPIVAYAGFLKALSIIDEFEISSIEKRAMKNASYVKERLMELDIDFYEFGDAHNSPIVSCVPNNLEGLEARLKKERVFCSIRNGRLRISPHFYNTLEDIDRLMGRLA